jgi:hypothetical protein
MLVEAGVAASYVGDSAGIITDLAPDAGRYPGVVVHGVGGGESGGLDDVP